MHFGTKSYLKNIHNYTTKHAFYVKDITCGAFMDKTHLCAIMVAERLLLRQPLDGDVILISCSSIYSSPSRQGWARLRMQSAGF
jgi:hypothetical protein